MTVVIVSGGIRVSRSPAAPTLDRRNGVRHSAPSPLVGEAQGGGIAEHPKVGSPPTPSPSPHGGGDSGWRFQHGPSPIRRPPGECLAARFTLVPEGLSQARKSHGETDCSDDKQEHAEEANEPELAHVRWLAEKHLGPGPREKSGNRRYCNVDVRHRRPPSDLPRGIKPTNGRQI